MIICPGVIPGMDTSITQILRSVARRAIPRVHDEGFFGWLCSLDFLLLCSEKAHTGSPADRAAALMTHLQCSPNSDAKI